MKTNLGKMLAVIRRDLLEIRSARVLAVFGLFALSQGVLMFVSKAPGRVEDTFLIFMFGSLAAILIGFDGIARERDQRTIDLLLTQGIPRSGLFAAKWVSLMILCVMAAGATIAGGVLGSLLSGKAVARWDLVAEFAVMAWLLCMYGALALACSVVLRRGKRALVTAIVVWMALHPMVIGNLILGPLGDALGWTKTQVWHIAACLPELAFRFVLDPCRAAPADVTIAIWIPYAALSIYLVGFSLLGWLVFRWQDEPAI